MSGVMSATSCFSLRAPAGRAPLVVGSSRHGRFGGVGCFRSRASPRQGRRSRAAAAPRALNQAERREIGWVESGEQYDKLLKESQEAGKLLVVNWAATWCRKCKYLKPKIEALAFAYPEVDFVVVDVNKVPQSVVMCAGVSKMPTLQLYRNGEVIEELIGADDAKAVVVSLGELVKQHQ